jgi:hypothetical protein
MSADHLEKLQVELTRRYQNAAKRHKLCKIETDQESLDFEVTIEFKGHVYSHCGLQFVGETISGTGFGCLVHETGEESRVFGFEEVECGIASFYSIELLQMCVVVPMSARTSRAANASIAAFQALMGAHEPDLCYAGG